MLNVDILTLGNEFKSDSGMEYFVESYFGDKDKIHITLQAKKVVEPLIDNVILD